MGKTVVLDNGHGGVIGGKYQTAGKRSPDWDKGVLYEGMFNRWIVNGVMKKLDYHRIPYYHISPELTDTSLWRRVDRCKDIYGLDKDTYLLSIHANAGGGTGDEIWTSIGQDESDKIATVLSKHTKGQYGQQFRTDMSDGDIDKENSFYIFKAPMPSLLYEVGFMDNKKDYELLWDVGFQEAKICALTDFIMEMYYNYEVV